MNPVNQDKVHCFRHAITHNRDSECVFCLMEHRIEKLEKGARGIFPGYVMPKPTPYNEQFEERQAEAFEAISKAIADAKPAICLTDGSPVTPDHLDIQANGMQKDYVVLCPEERDKGFVRPVRSSYRHKRCGAVTTMGKALAETYARDPKFYVGTFCSTCHTHFQVSEFLWDDGSVVGS